MIRTIELFQVKFCGALCGKFSLFFSVLLRDIIVFAVNNLFSHSLQIYSQ